MANNNKYREYFDIDEEYFPQVNDSAIAAASPDFWTRTYPHHTFIEMLNNMENCEKIPVVQPPTDPEAVLNGPLAADLSRIKRALAKCIGPVAGKTLKKALIEWIKTAEPSQSGLKNLIEILLLEIDDSGSKQGFLDDLKDLTS